MWGDKYKEGNDEGRPLLNSKFSNPKGGGYLRSKSIIGMMEEVEDDCNQCIGLSCKCCLPHIYMRNPATGQKWNIWLDFLTDPAAPAIVVGDDDALKVADDLMKEEKAKCL